MEQKEIVMETEICHNCKREVPQSNYLMHVAHCARNMAVCPVCGDAVPKAHLKEHRQQQHTLVECKDCRVKVQNGSMHQHRANSCGKRTVACQFCELELPNCDIPEHENYCGARTERCADCGELVMHKYRKLHLDSNHGFIKLKDEPGPKPSWERSPTNRNRQLQDTLESVAPATERVINTNNETATACCGDKVDYKSPLLGDSGGGNASTPAREPLWDAPRTLITPYDASEDLRAKVKLARHDLNNIKNSYLMNEERKQEQLVSSRYQAQLDHLPATNRRTREKFVTNLVPYEKNKSFQVNSMPLDEKPASYYNYLGAKETPPANLITISSKPKNVPMESTGALPKKATSNGTAAKRDLGAVPRASRKKGPAPPPPIIASVSSLPQSDVVTLPCEYCRKMVPAIQLVEHEAKCKPDLAPLRLSHTPSLESNASRSPEVQLPCEFCFSLYPASKLLSHQALCDV